MGYTPWGCMCAFPHTLLFPATFCSPLLDVFQSIYPFLYILCVSIPLCVCLCVCPCRRENNLGCRSSASATLFSEISFLIGLESTTLLVPLSSKATHLSFPSTVTPLISLLLSHLLLFHSFSNVCFGGSNSGLQGKCSVSQPS